MSLNILPNGKPSPRFKVTAIGNNFSGEEIQVTEEFQEWWSDGKKVQDVKECASDYFYTVTFDKAPFKIIDIERIGE